MPPALTSFCREEPLAQVGYLAAAARKGESDVHRNCSRPCVRYCKARVSARFLPVPKRRRPSMATILVIDEVPTNRQFLVTLLGYSQFTKVVQAVAPFWCTIVRLPLD